MLACSLRVSSLPFLVVLDMCTTLARLDLGMVRVFGYSGVVWFVVERKSLGYPVLPVRVCFNLVSVAL